jgi:hypothetical protein
MTFPQIQESELQGAKEPGPTTHAFYSPPEPIKENTGLRMMNRHQDSNSRPQFGSHNDRTPLPINEVVPGTATISWVMDSLHIQPIPMHFPTSNLHYEFSGGDLEDVLNRLAKVFRQLSIQTSFRSSPLSAFLQTCQHVALYLVFFQERVTQRNSTSVDSNYNHKLFMSVQRYRGDQLVANRYIQAFIEAARGVGMQEQSTSTIGLPRRAQTPKNELMQVVQNDDSSNVLAGSQKTALYDDE